MLPALFLLCEDRIRVQEDHVSTPLTTTIEPHYKISRNLAPKPSPLPLRNTTNNLTRLLPMHPQLDRMPTCPMALHRLSPDRSLTHQSRQPPLKGKLSPSSPRMKVPQPSNPRLVRRRKRSLSPSLQQSQEASRDLVVARPLIPSLLAVQSTR